MSKVVEVLATIVAALLTVFLISFIMAIPIMLLWDWLMPVLFGLGEITLMQAWGVGLLSGILFDTSKSSNNK